MRGCQCCYWAGRSHFQSREKSNIPEEFTESGKSLQKPGWLYPAASARRSGQGGPPCHTGHLAWPVKHSLWSSWCNTGPLTGLVKASVLKMEIAPTGVLATAWHYHEWVAKSFPFNAEKGNKVCDASSPFPTLQMLSRSLDFWNGWL